MIDEKKCSKCKNLKPDNNFSEGRALCNKCIEYKRQYREQHREELRLAQKEYYARNKEEIQQRKKEYYENNKEKINEKQKENNGAKIECTICKCKVGKYRMKIHEQSIKHQQKAYAQNEKQNS